MKPDYLKRDDKPDLAFHYTDGKDPLVMFCGGYRSDMGGTKATHLEAQCLARGQGYVRFDYSGHGQSDGQFADGTIGLWAEDALAIFDYVSAQSGQNILLVGSSMGGWISLLLASQRAENIAGLVGIAAAPDFTEDMFERRLSPAQQKELLETGKAEIPNDYSDEPYHFTRAFYEDGQRNLVLNKGLRFFFPLTLVQGKKDVDVPWQSAEIIKKSVEAEPFEILYVEDGDHRLSRPQDLSLIDGVIKRLSVG